MKQFPLGYRFQPDELEKIKKFWPPGRSVKDLMALFGKPDDWVRRFAARHRLPVETTYAGGATWAIRSVLHAGRKGRCVSLPRNFCRELNLNPGDKLLMEKKGGSIVVRKLKKKKSKR
ncbi:MAG: AbrB/MazE/SpoVT family DNA-binding domain-containing protein [candidate division Zixibacteria bacterium]|nr:AbrB/MazE/SpoVT family DNA-binding domain-containing protein [candidate division Zixibacteria bacterium]MCI0597017.1 AbrB/MazE/SpoVT family DNA-binding domain-containing protein [candidate division Zixibacteria bacterium]